MEATTHFRCWEMEKISPSTNGRSRPPRWDACRTSTAQKQVHHSTPIIGFILVISHDILWPYTAKMHIAYAYPRRYKRYARVNPSHSMLKNYATGGRTTHGFIRFIGKIHCFKSITELPLHVLWPRLPWLSVADAGYCWLACSAAATVDIFWDLEQS